MSLLNYAIVIIGIPIVIAVIYDLSSKFKGKVSEYLENKKQLRKEKEAQWEDFISEKYNEMKIWNPEIKYDDVKKFVLKNVRNKR